LGENFWKFGKRKGKIPKNFLNPREKEKKFKITIWKGKKPSPLVGPPWWNFPGTQPPRWNSSPRNLEPKKRVGKPGFFKRSKELKNFSRFALKNPGKFNGNPNN